MTKLIKFNIETHIKRISKENYSYRIIQSKRHYRSPLVFYGFGYLKQDISKRQPRNFEEVRKILWEFRPQYVQTNFREHFEHIKSIHSKLLK